MATTHRVRCPACSVKLKFGEPLIGQTVECPRCKSSVALSPSAESTTLATSVVPPALPSSINPAPPRTTAAPRVFISHASADRALVEQTIVNPLRQHGITTWFAHDDIHTADEWERRILDGLRECEWFLVAMSPRATQSDWVKDEVQWAVDERPRRMIPVLLAPCDPRQIHIRLARLQHLDFRKDPGQVQHKLLGLLGKKDPCPVSQVEQTHSIELPALGAPTSPSTLGQIGPYVVDGKREPGRKGDTRHGYYEAHDIDTNQRVRLEVWSAGAGWDDLRSARFKRAMRAWTGLHHPNLIEVYAAGAHRNLCYLAKERLTVQPLESLLEAQGPLPWLIALQVGIDIAHGLGHLHERGIVYRDVRPSNIVLHEGHAKLDSSFLAKEIIDREKPASREDDSLTAEGTLLGTPDYMAPEQARDPRDVKPAADLYALGGTLFHLLTGQPPYPDTSIMRLMIRHATEPIPLLKDRYPGAYAPTRFEEIIRRLLAKKPTDRYASTAELVLDLETLRPLAGAHH